jgi:replicative DNA helicase
MFVFREEYYREREKPGDHDIEGRMKWKDAMSALHGKAEVIIGKQRHGPIGTIELAFEGEFTRFSNIGYESQAEAYGRRFSFPGRAPAEGEDFG